MYRKLTILGPLLFTIGCSEPDLVVVDAVGNPIRGAIVTGTSPSIAGQQTRTDQNGHADIPVGIQKTKWIAVSKPGYTPVTGIDVNQSRPIRVPLQKK